MSSESPAEQSDFFSHESLAKKDIGELESLAEQLKSSADFHQTEVGRMHAGPFAESAVREQTAKYEKVMAEIRRRETVAK